MGIELIFKHQKKAYELMKNALEKSGRAAYIFPTGCGKSFPALKYVEENPDKNVTIVVPRNFIRRQFERNIKKYLENGKERLENKSIKVLTYQQKYFSYQKFKKEQLMKARERIKTRRLVCKKNLQMASNVYLPKLETDIVIFDEIHRMGAKEWEKVVDKLMKENPKRKVIGMTATPERTEKRNMAYEKFGNDVVYEMSLTDALSGRKEGEVLLKTPRYVRVLSELKNEIESYKIDIQKISSSEKREKLLKMYEKLDSIVSNAPDLQEVMETGLKKKNGKYIVFCKDRKDLLDKIEHASEIFGNVNSKINIDYVLSKNGRNDNIGKKRSENDKTLEDFETRENADALNLLFCVNMLDEGVHLDGIDGEILFDLTHSPILYKQRIGRVLSADKEAGETVIIDVSNNWLAQIETYREIDEAIKSGNSGNKDWYDQMAFTAEETDLLEILKEIREELGYNKGIFLRNAKKIQKWCEEKYGDKPREERYLPSNAQGNSEEERRLAIELKNLRGYILKKYTGMSLSQIENEEHRAIVQIIRNLEKEYGLPTLLKNAIKIQKWCEKKYGDKPIEERCLPRLAEESDEEEKRMVWMWNNIQSEVCKNYEGLEPKDIQDEHDREIVEIISYLNKEYGLPTLLKNAIKIQKWCEKKYGDKPIEERYLPSGGEKREEEEKTLAKYFNTIEQNVTKMYENIKLEEIEDENHREIVRIIRFLKSEYGLSESLKNAIRIQKWCEKKYKDMPRSERSLPSGGGDTEEEKRLAKQLHRLKQKICNKYRNKTLEEIEDENHREIVRRVRYLEENYMSEHQRNLRDGAIKGRMAKAVGKKVMNNLETRNELEGKEIQSPIDEKELILD